MNNTTEDAVEKKAKELVAKFKYIDMPLNCNFSEVGKDAAKECAIISCEETIEALERFGYAGTFYDDFEYPYLMLTTEDKDPAQFFRNVIEKIKSL